MLFAPWNTLTAVVVVAAFLLCHHQGSAFVSYPVDVGRVKKATSNTLLFSPRCPLPLPRVLTTIRMGYSASSVQEAWDNHFSAFGGKDVEKILLDYDENSVITTYEQTSMEKTVYKGIEEARKFFTGLFEMLSDTSDLAAPVIDVEEESKMVFLIWKCPASGFMDATDTFTFDGENKIRRQNVVFRTE